MFSHTVSGIIIKRANYGEGDRLLTIITKEHGKIKVLAKGIRKINSRRSGSVELFNFSRLSLSKGRSFYILSEAKVINTFPKIREDLRKIGVAFYAVELADKFISENQENEEGFLAIKALFCDLDRNPLVKILPTIEKLERTVLEISGFGVSETADGSELAFKRIEDIIGRSLYGRKFLSQISTTKDSREKKS